jgi:DNA-binding NarL/FixJ family response regulator
MKTRVLIADDHKIMREGLCALIRSQPELLLVGEAENGTELLQKANTLNPHVVLTDISMPGMNGVEATRRLMGKRPRTRVIALTVHADKRYVAEMFRAGAAGFLLKDCAFEEIMIAIRTVMKRKSYISPNIAGTMVRDYVEHLDGQEESVFTSLTSREREVLQRLAEGQTAKDIAHVLGVSPKTVDTFRRQVMQKLNLHSTAELTKYAIREGLTSLE